MVANRRKVNGGRKGKPLVVYFPREQALNLKQLSEKRHLPMANIVRFAVTRLLVDLQSGQLELPLGLEGERQAAERTI
jgi:hypothetical protein